MATSASDAERRSEDLPRVDLSTLASAIRSLGCDARAECPVTGGTNPEAPHPAAIRGMTVDSREVESGNLFVCKGAAFKSSYLKMAAEMGAGAYLCNDDPVLLEELGAAAPGLPRIVAPDVRRAMALAAPVVYDHPERDLTVIGITGTKGKTTAAYMLRSIMAADGNDPSIMGSIETDDGIQRFESHNTTPEAPELWRHLANTRASGRRFVIMEVSSQGLKYDRVLGLTFDVACFLNIGRDHISPIEHPTFEDYFESKLKIFGQSRTAVVNLATDCVDDVLGASRRARSLATFSSEPPSGDSSLPTPDFAARSIEAASDGIRFEVLERGEAHPIKLGMAGLFNVDNALAAISTARLLGIGYDAIERGLAHVRVPGRMELVPSADGKVLAIVDYAHNELSFRSLFTSIARSYPNRHITAVFGAPGDKALERREVLPRIASEFADLIVYTEEDPAHERVEDICAELVRNTPEGTPYRIICDREKAVSFAIEGALSREGESVVVLLGKGEETRQHRGDSYPAVKSDYACARELLD